MFVCIRELTRILPLSVRTPHFSKPMPSVLKRRPIEMSIFSAVSCSPDASIAVTCVSDFWTRVTSALVWMWMPFRFMRSWMWRMTCTSSVAKIVGRSSSTVTRQPSALKMEANSHPETPPPTIMRLSGSSLRFRIPVVVNTCVSSISKIGGSAGSEPVAMMTFLACTCSVVPSGFRTAILFLSVRDAVPLRV